MDERNVRLIYGLLENLSQDKIVINSTEKKYAASCSHLATTLQKLKLLPTYARKNYFVVATRGF